MSTDKIRLKNIKVEPYTWKAIAASAAVALAGIAQALQQIADEYVLTATKAASDETQRGMEGTDG